MLANKQDVQGALSVPEIQSIFNQMAQTLSARDSKVLPIAGLTGEGVKEAIEWMGLRVVRNAMHRPPLQSSS